jgi:hypothetical protein
VCVLQVYSQLDGDSHVVNTGWAILTLLLGGYHKVSSNCQQGKAKHTLHHYSSHYSEGSQVVDAYQVA